MSQTVEIYIFRWTRASLLGSPPATTRPFIPIKVFRLPCCRVKSTSNWKFNKFFRRTKSFSSWWQDRPHTFGQRRGPHVNSSLQQNKTCWMIYMSDNNHRLICADLTPFFLFMLQGHEVYSFSQNLSALCAQKTHFTSWCKCNPAILSDSQWCSAHSDQTIYQFDDSLTC